MSAPSRLERVFQAVIKQRRIIVAIYAVLLPLGIWGAVQVPKDDNIDRMVVESDPDYVATRAFQQIFPEAQIAVVLLESPDPYRPEALRELMALEDRLSQVPNVRPNSTLSVWKRTHPTFSATPEEAAAFKAFCTGTDLFRRQGLVGEGFLSIATLVTTSDQKARNVALHGIDQALGPVGKAGSAFTAVRKVGRPYIETWLEEEMSAAYSVYIPAFVVFVLILIIAIYRSWRALAAMVLALGTTVALSVAVAYPLGYSFAMISAAIPLTILVTATASLVYLHSRYVDRPPEVPLEEHHPFAIANKFLPVTASLIAAMLGFAALGVSQIRPVREMGVWIALGMVITWLVAFTLFPVLQRLLRCPTRAARTTPARTEALYQRFVETLPAFTYRYRWPLVLVPVAICVAGTFALFGVPGRLAPMKVEVDAIEYVNPDMPLYRDMRYFEKSVSGLSVARVWVKTSKGGVIDPELLRGLESFSRDLEKYPYVASALGPTGILRMKRYLGGQGDALPTDPEGFAEATGDLEQLLISEIEFQGFIDVKTLSNANIMVITHGSDYAEFEKLIAAINDAWARNTAANPALKEASIQVVGQSVLQSKIGANLVPTLTESFALTAALIFVTFLVVFRNGAARLMAMIPSLFAILATFLAMRLFGGTLNVATIILATTVLGTTENDQIHFFYHLQEGQKGNASMERALRHSLLVSGRAIIFATLINAAGFIALAPSGLPLLRQFGVVTALAFLLSMLADFTALPAALWILFREKPDEAQATQSPPEAPVTQPPEAA